MSAPHRRIKPVSERESSPLGDLKSIVCVLQVSGVLPIYSDTGPSEISVASGLWPLYRRLIHIVHCVAVCFVGYRAFLAQNSDLYVSYSSLDSVNNKLEVILVLVSYCVVVAVSAHKSPHFLAIANELLQLDAQLGVTLCNHCEFSWKYLILIAVMLTYDFTLWTVTIHHFGRQLQATFYLMVSLYAMQIGISAIFIVFVAALVQLVSVRFSHLNRLLSAYTAQPRGYRQRSTQTMRSTELSDDSDDAATTPPPLMAQFPADAVFIYRMHNRLLELYAAINEYANHALLAFLGCSFYTITSSVYNLYLTLRTDAEISWTMMQWFTLWLVFQVAIIALITNRCDRATKKANNTSLILARVYGKSKEYENIIDKYLTKSIKQDIKFTAYGFFVIDNSTLFKIFSAVTTYSVILIQFKQLEDSKAEEDA